MGTDEIVNYVQEGEKALEVEDPNDVIFIDKQKQDELEQLMKFLEQIKHPITSNDLIQSSKNWLVQAHIRCRISAVLQSVVDANFNSDGSKVYFDNMAIKREYLNGLDQMEIGLDYEYYCDNIDTKGVQLICLLGMRGGGGAVDHEKFFRDFILPILKIELIRTHFLRTNKDLSTTHIIALTLLKDFK